MRATLKRAGERLLATGARLVLPRFVRDQVFVLAYHNVVPRGHESGKDPSLHLPRAAFAEQLDSLMESHRVVALSKVLRIIDEGSRQQEKSSRRPRAVITFDDAYRGAMTSGLEELSRRDLPATVFVSPAALGADGFWWDRLGDAMVASDDGSQGGHPGPDREAMLEAEAGRDSRIIERAHSESWPLESVPESAQPVTEGELVAAVDEHEITLGAHGWSHANLAELSAGELKSELDRPLDWLTSRFGEAALPVLAYPYGRFSSAVTDAARQAGYRAAFAVSGGPFHPSDSDPHRLPRVNVPAGVSVDGFRLRAFGLLT